MENGISIILLQKQSVVVSQPYHCEILLILHIKREFYLFNVSLCLTATSKHCGPPPKVENAIVTVAYKKKYSANSSVTYRCREKYQIEKEDTVTCRSGEWEVKNITCTRKLVVEEAMEKQRYLEGEVIEYVCTSPHVKAGGNATCRNGEWIKTEECPGCSHPPQVTNGDTLSFTKPDYQEGERVEYSCFSRYTMEGGPFKTCRNGKWEGEMRCLGACTVDEQLMEQNNLRFTYSWQTKLYAVHKDYISFSCKRGRRVGTVPLRVQCIDGVMELPTCQ
uniref:Complement factor H-related protein 5-like n=1 Tax=Cyprinodon variegatus TaxID=28743 RepID=A0A3Q2D6U0_CYPVA